MTCRKTGFHAYIIPTQTFVRGDAFLMGGIYIFRISAEDPSPMDKVIHYEIHDYAYEWRGPSTVDIGPSIITIPAFVEDVTSYGYEGRPLAEFPYIAEALARVQYTPRS